MQDCVTKDSIERIGFHQKVTRVWRIVLYVFEFVANFHVSVRLNV